MHQALITGASQGFGRALLGALVARGWTCAVDARDATALDAATAGLANVRAVPGDVADPGHRAAVVAAAGERLDLLVHNASELGPSPLPSLADLPARRAAPRLRGRRARSAGAHPARAARAAGAHRPRPSSCSAPTPPSRPTPAGVGTARRRQRWTTSRPSSPSSTRTCACTPSTPATCAPRCTRPPSPARTSPTAPEPATVVPALLRLLDERPDSGRYRAADLLAPPMTPRPMTHRAPASPCRPSWARPNRRSSAGWPGTRCGCSSPQPAGRSGTPCSATSPRSSGRATSSWSTPPPPAPRRSTGWRADGRPVTVHVSHQVPHGRRLGRRAAHARRGRADPGRACRRDAPAAPRGDGHSARRAPGPGPRRRQPAVGGSYSGRRVACRAGWTGSAARSPTATCASARRWRPTRRCSPGTRAAPRCPARADRSRPRTCSPSSPAAASSVAEVTLHTGVSSTEAGEATTGRVVPGPGRHRAAA